MKTISLIDKKSSENPSFNNAIFNKFVEKLKYFNYDYDLIEVEYKSDRYGPLPAPGSFFDFKMKQFYKILENHGNNRSFNGYIEDKNKNTINTLLDIYEL